MSQNLLDDNDVTRLTGYERPGLQASVVPDDAIELTRDISDYLHDIPSEADGGDSWAIDLAARCRTILASKENK